MDSLTRQEMDITPFKNILNDMYSRDISKKGVVRTDDLFPAGDFCGGQSPLGLMRDPEDRRHLIFDPETAPVIRKIYSMALDGWGSMRIAKQLMEDKVPITRVKKAIQNVMPIIMCGVLQESAVSCGTHSIKVHIWSVGRTRKRFVPVQ